MADAVTITLPVPTAYAVPLDAFPRYLLAHGWVPELGGYKPGRECTWRHESGGSYIRSPGADDCDLPGQLAYMIKAAAKQMGIEPSALAAQLGPAGPAIQWARASADTRAPVLALLDSEAAAQRSAARVARAMGDIENALAYDGVAMAHEAAAAVLRGGGR